MTGTRRTESRRLDGKAGLIVKLIRIFLGAFVPAYLLLGAASSGLLTSALKATLIAGEANANAAGQTEAKFDQEWATLIAAAKREGRVEIAAGGEPSRNYRPLLSVFQNKFGIEAELSTGNARDTVNRVLAERRAGSFTIDIGLIAHNTAQRRLVPAMALTPIEPLLIHPEVTNKSLWLGNRYYYADTEQKYVFLYTARPENSWQYWYNTKSASQKEIASIKSLEEFLRPQWKGKMASLAIEDPSGLASLIHLYLAPDAGPEWVKRYMFEMDVTFVGDRRLLQNWLTQGKFPLQFPASSVDELLKLAKAGLPIKAGEIAKKSPGLILGGSSCCIEAFDRPPHPNAAKLFLNWFLSKEGQAEVNRIKGFLQASLRADIGFGSVDPEAQRRRGISYRFDEAEPWRAEKSNEAVKQIQAWWNMRTK
jgi:ABC-type Fe3+ transport system substrate-binding protein